MERRDFFGVIAAPLFRNLVPPKITCSSKPLTAGGTARIGRTVEISSHVDPAKFRRKLITLLDEGSLSFDGIFVPDL